MKEIIITALCALSITCWCSSVLAQEGRLSYTYRFSLDVETDVRHQKEVVHFLSSDEGPCFYIPEADCFKWTTDERLEHADLAQRLALLGLRIGPKALRSDGIMLWDREHESLEP